MYIYINIVPNRFRYTQAAKNIDIDKNQLPRTSRIRSHRTCQAAQLIRGSTKRCPTMDLLPFEETLVTKSGGKTHTL